MVRCLALLGLGFGSLARAADTDADGVDDAVDVCPATPDPSQSDTNHDGYGDACAAPTAVVGQRAVIGAHAYAGANTTIGAGASLGAWSQVGVGATVAPKASLEAGTSAIDGVEVGAGAMVGRRTAVGRGTTIGAGAKIAADVLIGRDVVIGAGVVIGYGTVIADGVEIQEDAVVGDRTSIAANATIGQGTSLGRAAVVGAGATIGTNTKIGANGSVGAGASVGTLVKARRGARIGAGAQIGDRSVLGRDSDTGDGSTLPVDSKLPPATTLPNGTTYGGGGGGGGATPTWGADFRVGLDDDGSSGEDNESEPYVALDPSGNATVVWYNNSGIHARRYGPSGVAGPIVDVFPQGYNVRVAAWAGGAIAIWRNFDGAYYARYAGGAWEAPVHLTSAAGMQDTCLSITDDGYGLITWYSFTGTPETSQVGAAPVRAGVVGAPSVVATGSNWGCQVSAQSAGAGVAHASVVWNTTIGGVNRAMISEVAVDSAPVTFPSGTILANMGDFAFPYVVRGSNHTVVAWRESGTGVVRSLYRPPTGSFGPVVTHAQGPFGNQELVLAGNDAGQIVLGRQYNESEASHVFIETLVPGTGFGAPVEITSGADNAGLLAIDVGPDGAASAIWFQGQYPGYSVYGADRTAAGVWGPSSLFENDDVNGHGNGTNNAVARGAGGRAFAVWTREHCPPDPFEPEMCMPATTIWGRLRAP